MRITRIPTAVLAAALLLAGCGPAAGPAAIDQAGLDAAAPTRFGQIAFQPCTLPGVQGAQSTSAQCARYDVPEDPAHPDGRTIGLNIAWLPVEHGQATGDPILMLAGGPGQAATEHAAAARLMLAEAGKQRDVLLIDQRGTGKSNPLDCRDAHGEPMSVDTAATPSAETMVAFARACAAGLAGRADPRFYTTTDAVRDLETVRAALGVEQVNLLGISYGTRVAQQYAAAHPQHTRSVILDGTAPNDLVIGGEFARTLEDALALQSARCQETTACRERFPTDMRGQLRQVMATLEARPVAVDYLDPRTSEPRHGTVTADAVGGLAFMFSYAPQTASLLPLVLDEAAQGRYAPLMSLVQLGSGQMEGQMTRGMQWSVLCAEDAGRYRPDTAGADTIIGPELGEAFFAPCQAWPHGEAPAGFHRPFASDLPVLLLSGELDPVTPPRYAEQVVANLPNGRHLMLPGQGHNVAPVGCMPKLLGRFLETADAKGLDTSCLDGLGYVPPFLHFNGWSP